MGKILLYGAGRACQSLLTEPTNGGTYVASTHAWKDLNGNTYNQLLYATDSKGNLTTTFVNVQHYLNVTGYASADTETDFSLDHYDTRAISGLTYSRSNSAQTGGRIYTIQVTNENADEVSVGSFKFTKTLKDYNGGVADRTALIFGYFFDTPVTIPAGGTKTFVVNFDS